MKRLIPLLTAITVLALPATALAKLGCPNFVMANGTPEGVNYGPRNLSVSSPEPLQVGVRFIPHAGYEALQGAGPFLASGYQFWDKPLKGWAVLYRQESAGEVPTYGPWERELTLTAPEWRALPYPEGQLGEGQSYTFTVPRAGKWGVIVHWYSQLHGPALEVDPFLALMRDEPARGVCENEIETPPGVWANVAAPPLRAAHR